MQQSKKCIATSAVGLALTIVVGVCQAQSIGTVADLQGTLLSKSAAGAMRILAPDSSIESGDRLLTRPATYARMVLTDGTAVTLGPDSELLIVQYSYSVTSHANNAEFDFVQGQVQIAAGRLGARSVDRFMLNTSIGTIAAGHATFIASYQSIPATARLYFPKNPWTDRASMGAGQVASDQSPPAPTRRHFPTTQWTDRDSIGTGHVENVVYHPPTDVASPRLLLAQNMLPAPTGITPGLYVQVIDGAINLSNAGGSQNFAAGQFGYTPSIKQPPVIVPANPGLQFTPPPAFSQPTQSSAGPTAAKAATVDCEVR